MERRQTRREEAASAYWVMEFVADQVKDVGKKLSDLARDMQTRAHTHTHTEADSKTNTNRPRHTSMCCHFLFIYSIYYCMAM